MIGGRSRRRSSPRPTSRRARHRVRDVPRRSPLKLFLLVPTIRFGDCFVGKRTGDVYRVGRPVQNNVIVDPTDVRTSVSCRARPLLHPL